jgi:hypothetical protein
MRLITALLKFSLNAAVIKDKKKRDVLVASQREMKKTKREKKKRGKKRQVPVDGAGEGET